MHVPRGTGRARGRSVRLDAPELDGAPFQNGPSEPAAAAADIKDARGGRRQEAEQLSSRRVVRKRHPTRAIEADDHIALVASMPQATSARTHARLRQCLAEPLVTR